MFIKRNKSSIENKTNIKVKNLVIISILFLLMVSCKMQKDYYENGQLKEKGKITNNKKTGKWKYFYKTGELKIDAQYIDDIPDGEWVFYYKNGVIKEIGFYAIENWSTFMVRMRKSGAKNPEEHYLNKNDVWKKYFENGQLMEIGKYNKVGLEIGEWNYYYQNGKLKEYRIYTINGVATFPTTIKKYDKDGILSN